MAPAVRPITRHTHRTPLCASAAARCRATRPRWPSQAARSMPRALLRLRPRRRRVDARARGRPSRSLCGALPGRGLHASSPKFQRPLERGATVTAIATVRERVGLRLHAAPEIDRKAQRGLRQCWWHGTGSGQGWCGHGLRLSAASWTAGALAGDAHMECRRWEADLEACESTSNDAGRLHLRAPSRTEK